MENSRSEKLQLIVVLISLVAVLAFLAGFSLIFSPAKDYATENVCTTEKAKEIISKAFFQSLPSQLGNLTQLLKVESVSPVKIGDVTLCEAVFYLDMKTTQIGNETQKMPVYKNVVYFSKNFVFSGEIRELSDGNVIFVTRDRLQALNKEYVEYVNKLAREVQGKKIESETVKKVVEKEFEDLKKKADIKFVSKTAKAEAVSFVSPTCPHCARMKEVLLKKFNEGKLSVYFIFTSLSPFDERIGASTICDKKSDQERLKAFNEKYTSKDKICETGLKKVRENVDLFTKLGGRGVPLTYFKVDGEVEVVEGERSENYVDSILE